MVNLLTLQTEFSVPELFNQMAWNSFLRYDKGQLGLAFGNYVSSEGNDFYEIISADTPARYRKINNSVNKRVEQQFYPLYKYVTLASLSYNLLSTSAITELIATLSNKSPKYNSSLSKSFLSNLPF